MPLVADMSSTILSRPIDVQVAAIYATPRKISTRRLVPGHCAPRVAGARPVRDTCYAELADPADNDSMYNTPPTFALYLTGLVFVVEKLGGLEEMAAINRRKRQPLVSSTRATSTTIRWRPPVVR